MSWSQIQIMALLASAISDASSNDYPSLHATQCAKMAADLVCRGVTTIGEATLTLEHMVGYCAVRGKNWRTVAAIVAVLAENPME